MSSITRSSLVATSAGDLSRRRSSFRDSQTSIGASDDQARLREDSLPARTSVTPDIPAAIPGGLLPVIPDLSGGQAFVISVVPFANIVSDLYAGLGPHLFISVLASVLPGKSVPTSQSEKLKRSLSTFPWRDIAVSKKDGEGES